MRAAALSLADYDRLAARLRAAWVQLNTATDRSDAPQAVAALYAAWTELGQVIRELHPVPGADADEVISDVLLGRYHRTLLRTHTDPAVTIQSLIRRARQLEGSRERHIDNVHDADLIHETIPVIWRVIRGLRDELRRRRPWAYHRRSCSRVFTILILLGLLWELASVALPWGCRITYFDGEQFAHVRGWSVNLQLVQDYDNRRPALLVHRHHWSARWHGVLDVPQTADYEFYSQSSDGLRMWIDGDLVIDNWKEQDWLHSGFHATRHLTRGRHTIRLDYFNASGNAALRVRWCGGPIPPNTVIGFPYLKKY